MKNKHQVQTTRRDLLLGTASLAFVTACSRLPALPSPKSGEGATPVQNEAILQTMKRASTFMRERCAAHGGYVWAYSADLSKRWGEMEAYPSMIWIQPPGTATVGHLCLDCYHATNDDYYYNAAVEVAQSLIAAQHPSGGWNYLHDFAGEESIRRWYDTIGKNGWRLEEFHHYYGNSTFDDAGTSESSQLLLRMYLEKRDKQFLEPLEKAIRFVLDSQYDNGGWPQRFPFVDDTPELHGLPDYTRFITFNDDVARENIKFLLMVWQSMGDQRAMRAIRKAMNVFVTTQNPAPQAGWGLQHTLDNLAPIGARSFEPTALVTHTTGSNIQQLLNFYEWTGDPVFLSGLPDAFDWLDSVRLSPDEVVMPGREFPTLIELGTNRALFTHRRGSNVVNGQYYQDYSPEKIIAHYSQWRAVDLDGLRKKYITLRNTAPAALISRSPFNKQPGFELPRYFTTKTIEVSDLNSNIGSTKISKASQSDITRLVRSLNNEGYWPTPLRMVSNPYIGEGSVVVPDVDYSETRVGDAYDTSPYISQTPVMGISLGSFIQNMSALMQVVAPEEREG